MKQTITVSFQSIQKDATGNEHDFILIAPYYAPIEVSLQALKEIQELLEKNLSDVLAQQAKQLAAEPEVIEVKEEDVLQG